MKKNKGFTLVELLAVIVILAVIALIATPQILRLIDDSRTSAAEDSMYGYIKAVEQAYVKDGITSESSYANQAYTKLSNAEIDTTAGMDPTLKLDLKGTAPQEDTTNILVIDESGTIECANIKFNNFFVSYDGNSAVAHKKADDLATCELSTS